LMRMQMEWNALACHSERQRRISRVGQRDSSLTLRMTVVAASSFFARCAESAIGRNQWGGVDVRWGRLRRPSRGYLLYHRFIVERMRFFTSI